MLEIVGAVVVMLFLALVPGLAIAAAITPTIRRQPILWLTLAPVLSIGANFLVAQVLDLAGLSVVPTAPLLVLVGAVAATMLRVIETRRSGDGAALTESTDSTPTPSEPTARAGSNSGTATATDRRSASWLLVAAILIGAAVWGMGLRGQHSEPPGRDGLYHGFFVERIVKEGTIDPADVVVTDPVTEQPAASFYPLALHLTIAGQRSLTHEPVGLLLTLWTAAAACALFPASMFCLTRKLLPARPLVAGCTALAVPFFSLFPYQPMDWSGIGVIVGTAMVPVSAAIVLTAATSRRRGDAVLAVGAVYAVLATHTSQAGLLVIIVGVLELANWWSTRSWHEIRSRTLTLALVSSGALVLYLPGLVRLRSASAERSDLGTAASMPLANALGNLITMSTATTLAGQSLLALLALVGVVLAVRRRELLAWGWVGLALLVLYLASAVTTFPWSTLRPLSQPWYYEYTRTSYHAAPVLAVFVGYAFAELLRVLTPVAVRIGVRDRRWVTYSVLATAVVLAAPTMLRQPVRLLRAAYETDSRVDADMAGAFDYLAAHDDGRMTVLNEERDGSAWMYADRGLRPLVGVYRYGETEQNDARLRLLSTAGSLGSDPETQQLIERWDVRYVLVNDVGFSDEPPRVRADALRANPRFREVYSRGGSHVFEVVASNG